MTAAAPAVEGERAGGHPAVADGDQGLLTAPRLLLQDGQGVPAGRRGPLAVGGALGGGAGPIGPAAARSSGVRYAVACRWRRSLGDPSA